MSDCAVFLDSLTSVATPDDERLQQHAAACPACRHELAAHRELERAFQGLAQPALSPHFHRRLRVRLQEERRDARRAERCHLLMKAYWAVAGLLIIYTLLLTRWPSSAPSGPAVALLATLLGAAAVAWAILRWTLRAGLLDILLGTVRVLRR